MARPESFPTAHQLELIAAVADHGGVSAAAESLAISQPAVTAQLRAAEETIGQRLFVRTHTGLVPTAAGRAVAAFARRQISLRRGLMAAMAELTEGKSGTLVIGGSTTPGEYWLPDRISIFRRAYPNVDIRVLLGNSRETLARLEAGAVDVAAVGLKKRARGLKFTEVAVDRIVAVAARGSRWTRGGLRARTLEDAAFIVREEGSATREVGLACLRRAGVTPKQLMPLASNEAVARMTAADLGIGILSLHAAQRHVDDGRLAFVRVHGWKCRQRVYLVGRSDVRNPLVDAFWNIAVKGGRVR
jgi:DNA-binding transcriptional LysR family regulator